MSTRYDSDAGRLFFASNDSDWTLAFDGLPPETLYPAVSLYQRDDKVCLQTSVSRKADAGQGGDGDRDEGGFVEHVERVAARTHGLLDGPSGARHPCVTVLLPALAAAVVRKSGALLRSTLRLLPPLTLLSRRVAGEYEAAEEEGDVGYVGRLDGMWAVKCSAAGASLPAQEYLLTLRAARTAEEPGEDADYLKPFRISGAGEPTPPDWPVQSSLCRGFACLPIGKGASAAVEAAGSVLGTRLHLREHWSHGSDISFDARVSVDANYFSGRFTEVGSGASGVVEAHRMLGQFALHLGIFVTHLTRLFLDKETQSDPPSRKSLLFKVSLLLVNACGRLVASLADGADLSAQCSQWPEPTEADDSPSTDTGAERATAQKWIQSDLFAGGLPSAVDVNDFFSSVGATGPEWKAWWGGSAGVPSLQGTARAMPQLLEDLRDDCGDVKVAIQ